MRSVKRPLNWLLLGIALASVAAILLGQENPFVRAVVCVRMPCRALAHSHAWEKIAYDLGIGSIVSLFFYWLVVRLPENAKRRRIRKSFAEHFREFKEDSIATMLMVTDDTFAWGPGVGRSKEISRLLQARGCAGPRPVGLLFQQDDGLLS
jgi:hypothetical protein